MERVLELPRSGGQVDGNWLGGGGGVAPLAVDGAELAEGRWAAARVVEALEGLRPCADGEGRWHARVTGDIHCRSCCVPSVISVIMAAN
jgi:hypothetical protein